ncbi:hypothetical protein EIP91_008583 [Steccherinum ochraceum]|uniref:Acyl-protein thioesterase 1 n=1 Tax=Steccherinum ochraceum TaxID=92696 RepID=A0A4R0R2L6_9APHY|nr:hypothetical protein EIP91_008583 [Steccherinum ochraceum]
MATSALLSHITVPATAAKHTATIIFVHGLGDTGAGWKFVAEDLGRHEKLRHVKWILPNAPKMRVTANSGMEMSSWFDIFAFDGSKGDDVQGMQKTVSSLSQLISNEVDSGIPSERIVLGGFSQGAAMTLLTGLTTEWKLGGLVALSGRLPMQKELDSDPTLIKNTHFAQTPLFWGHGTADPLVPFSRAETSVEFLRTKIGVKDTNGDSLVGLKFHAYAGMQHTACDVELEHLREWLSKAIPEESS